MFLFHSLRRVCESLCIHRFSPDAKMSLAMYLVGMIYYVAVPLTLVIESTIFSPSIQPGSRFCEPFCAPSSYILTAWIVFLYGNYEQHRAHRILARLRECDNVDAKVGNGKKHLQTRYQMPRGGWFDTVAAPHYTFEIVIYMALVIGSRFSLTAILCWSWVLSNLTVTADRTHRWYQENFGKSYRTRSRLFPGAF